MDANARHRDRALPPLSGQTLSGVAALLAVCGFAFVALPPLLSGASTRSMPFAEGPEPVAVSAPGPEAPPPEAVPPAAPAPAALVPRPGNRPPTLRRVEFTRERVTAQSDLRLQVEVFDPDGDPVSLHTTWHLPSGPLATPTPVLPREHLERGARLQVTVVAADGSHESEPWVSGKIVVGNAAPTITTFPRGFDANGAFVYPIGAVDPDDDPLLEFALVEGPPGMRIEAHEGTLTWRPRPEQAGRHRVRVEVSDGLGGRSAQVFVLWVRTPRPADASGTER